MGTDDGGEGAFTGGGASGSGALDAAIQENHVTVTIVTLNCAGDCADVEAVATGGHPPYSFGWDDGSTNAKRRVCPTSSTSFGVKVTDTGSTGEFARSPETVHVPLTARVLACLDGGASDAGACASATDAFNVAATFVTSGANPAGAWSYGYSATLGADAMALEAHICKAAGASH